MMKTLKKNLILVGALCAGVAFSLAIPGLNNEVAFADTTTPDYSEFYMQEGAAVRTSSDEVGIRFGATITEDYWQALQTAYGADASYTFYSVVTDGEKPIRKDYEGVLPSFEDASTYTFHSTIVYKTETLIAQNLLDEACNLPLSAQTYIDIVKAGETEAITIAAYGETGERSMKAVANAAVLAGETDEDLLNYFTVANRSETAEGYMFEGESGVIEMKNLPDMSETTDMEVYVGAQKVEATYQNGVISFDGANVEKDKTVAYVSVFTSNGVYSSKVESALKITQDNAEDLLTLSGNETVYLAEDIDLAGIEWNTAVNFAGKFDGGNHAIDNLTTVNANGFFKNVNGATIKNVAFTNIALAQNSGAITYQPAGGLNVINTLIQVKSTTAGGRVGAICERSNNQVALNLTDVVIVMPKNNSNEAIYGYAVKGSSKLSNVHCIGLNNAITSVANAEQNIASDSSYTLHTSLGGFATVKTTLTPFLDDCVKNYLNVVKISQDNVGDLLTLKGNETVGLLENINIATYLAKNEIANWISKVTFTGTFDGGNHVIDQLVVPANGTAGAYVGLFANLSGTVRNVAFANVTIGGNCGVLAGVLTGNSLVENVFIYATKTSSSASTRYGAIVGRAQNSGMTVTLKNLVIKMPGTATKESIFGWRLYATAILDHVYTIGLKTASPYPYADEKVNGSPSVTNSKYSADLAAFNTGVEDATITLTPFLTTCVEAYLNA